jgi:multidrug efflux system membrane fusion protein
MFPAGASMVQRFQAADRSGLRYRTPLARFAWVALCGFLGALGCNGGGSSADARPAVAPVPVTVTLVAQKDMPVEVRAVGTAEAVSTVQVLPQVSGLIQEVHFKEGDSVKKDQLLFTIDTRPYRASLSAAQAELEKNKALAEQARADLERYEKLGAEGLASQLELSKARANAAALVATLGQNRASIQSNSINVQFAAIRSPIDGKTGSLLVHAGNVVSPTDVRPLVVIRSLAPMYVRFAVPEQSLPAVRSRFKEGHLVVQAKPRGAATEPVVGELSLIENTVDPATGKIDMKARFSNDGEVLWPGQFVDVVVGLSLQRGALVVPESAVQTGQDGAYVFVVGPALKASLRKVTVDRIVGAEVVLQGGVTAGERVASDGLVRLRDGAAVQIKQGSVPSAEASSDSSARAALAQPGQSPP